MAIILYPGKFNIPDTPSPRKNEGPNLAKKISNIKLICHFGEFQWKKLFYPLDDFNLQKCLTQLIDAPQEDRLKEKILSKCPALNELICLTRQADHNDRSNLAPLLFVLAGIKPVLVIERFYQIPFRKIAKLMRNFPHVDLARDDKYFYIINENPLFEFDPRKFIHSFDENYKSIRIAAIWSFQHQAKSSLAVQLLSYLLGYGATFEAFNAHTHRPIPAETVFSDEHYLSLGQVREPGNTRAELISLGKAYSQEALERKRPNFGFSSPEFGRLRNIYGGHIVAEVPYRTDYIQHSLIYKERLLKAFNIQSAS